MGRIREVIRARSFDFMLERKRFAVLRMAASSGRGEGGVEEGGREDILVGGLFFWMSGGGGFWARGGRAGAI